MTICLIITAIVSLLCIFKPSIGVIFTACFIQYMAHLGAGVIGLKMYYVTACVCIVCVLIYTFYKGRPVKYPKLILIASLFNTICYLISNHYAFEPHTMLVLANIATTFIFPITLWLALNSSKNLNIYTKITVIISVIAVIGVVPEIILGHNYITDFEQDYMQIEDFMIDAEGARFGVKRTNSIFSYFTTFGTYCLFSSFFFFCLRYVYGIKKILKINITYLYIALLLCGFTTGSRAVILALFIIIIICLRSKYFNQKISKVQIAMIIFFSSPVLVPTVYKMVDSIVNSDKTEYAQGSSTEMRQEQLDACLEYTDQSPIWGNGRLYLWDYVKPVHPELLGAESVWFQLIVDYGLMGCLGYLFIIFACSWELYKTKKFYGILPIGYLAITSFSPDTGIQLNTLICMTLVLIKSDVYLSRKKVIKQ